MNARVKKFPPVAYQGHERINPAFGEMIAQRVHDLMSEGRTMTDIAWGAGISLQVLRYHMEPRTFLPRPKVFWGLCSALNLKDWEMYEAAYWSVT